MMRLLRRFLGLDELETPLAHWSETRAEQAEQQTYRELGIRPEPHYTWSHQFRKGSHDHLATQ